MLPKIALMVFSLLVGCAVARPKADACLVDAKTPRLICFNLKDDYDEKGKMKAEAKPHFKPITSLSDIDKFTVFDSDSWVEMQVYIEALKQKAETIKRMH